MSTMADRQWSTIADMNGTLGSRLKAERANAGLTQQGLADVAGVTKQAISQIERGDTQSPGASTIDPIARRLGVSTRWLLDGIGPRIGRAGSVEPEWADIRGYAQAVGLGNGPEAQEYAETHRLKFRTDSLARKRLNPDNLGVMYGSGDSMLPRIHPGDAILFDTADTTQRDGHLYVVMLDGAGAAEYQVKRCQIIADMVFFSADNPAGDHNWRKPRLMEDHKRPITVIGRVRWIGSWER